MLKKTLVWVIPILALAGLAASASRWLPALLGFAGAHSDAIQRLTGLGEIVLWGGAVGLAGHRLWARQGDGRADSQGAGRDSGSRAAVRGGAVAQGRDNVVSGDGVAVGRDVHGNVIVIQAGAGPLDAERFWRHLVAGRPAADLTRATERYLEYLVEYYRYLDFRGMGVSDRVPLRLPLLEMYIPLRARVETPEGETWTRSLRLAGRRPAAEEEEVLGGKVSGPRPVLDLLREHDGLVLLGDPGAGKTTFLKFLALALATGQGEALGLGRRLPVLLPLAAYAQALAAGDVPLVRFLARYYQEDREVGFPLDAMLREGLARGGVLLLLDGLDEVREPELRHLVIERVRELYSLHRRAGNKFVLTSRIVGYREVRPASEGLVEATLVDLEDKEVEEFVGKWTAALEKAAGGEGRMAVAAAARERGELLAATRGNPGVRALAANPLLLTILALMKRQGVALPERRVELYKTYVETLLRHWNLARSLTGRSGREVDTVETMKVLPPLALYLHESSPGEGLVREGDLHRELERIFRGRGAEDPEKATRQFLADVREHAALLLDRGGRQYGFIHLTFQEYLAGVAVAQRAQQGALAVVEILAPHVGEASWQEVILLCVGHLGVVQHLEEFASEVLLGLLDRAPGPPGEMVVLAGRAVVEAGPGGVLPACRNRVVQALQSTMRDAGVQAVRRAAAGHFLGQLGDPRPEVMTVDGMEFVEVPPGGFWIGSGEAADNLFEKARPAHRCEMPYGYRMGRCPVTVAQFREYVEASGERPENGDSLRGGANEPVALVSFGEAISFCRWLTARWHDNGCLAAGWEVTLASEAEWEKAARGEKGRIYPWDGSWDPERANSRESGIGAVSSVGCFPGGASVYGCEEMSGNVWEWTRSEIRGYPYLAEDGREDIEGNPAARRVLRGGSCINSLEGVRCPARVWRSPSARDVVIGFRVVCRPHSPLASVDPFL